MLTQTASNMPRFPRWACTIKSHFPAEMKVSVLAFLCCIVTCAHLSAQGNGLMTWEDAKQRADQGDSFAQAVVALHCQLGWNTEKNPELAARYAIASAKAGVALGQFRLGALLREGIGVPRDEQRGAALQAACFKRLYSAEDPYSLTAAGILIFQGKVVGVNVPVETRRRDAAALYKKAADQGYAPAQFNYAMAANDGSGIARNSAACDLYLKRALSSNYPLAINFVAELNKTSKLVTSSKPYKTPQQGQDSLTAPEPEIIARDLKQMLNSFDIASDRVEAITEYIDHKWKQVSSNEKSKKDIELYDRVNGTAETIQLPNQSMSVVPEEVLADIAKPWPREKDPEWPDKFLSLQPIFQNLITKEIYSEAIGDQFQARTYVGDSRVFIYDKKSRVEIECIDPDKFFYWNRDAGITPRNLCISADEKFLLFRRETYGSVGGVVYVVNLQTSEVISRQCGFPLFVKSEQGQLTIPEAFDERLKYREFDGSGQDDFSRFELPQGYELFVKDGKEKTGADALLRGLLARYEDECRSQPLARIQLDLQGVADLNGSGGENNLEKCNVRGLNEDPASFVIDWPGTFGKGSFCLEVEKLNLRMVSQSELESGKPHPAAVGPKMTCFWGYLADHAHDCDAGNGIGVTYCEKNIRKGLITESASGRWLSLQCVYDLGVNASGWQLGQAVGLYDRKKECWVALPELKPPWERESVSPGDSPRISFSGLRQLPAGAPFPLLLPSRIGQPNDLQKRIFFPQDSDSVWISTHDDGLYEIGLEGPSIKRRINGITPFGTFAVSSKLIVGIPQMNIPKAEIWENESHSKLADVFFASDRSALFVLREGYYATTTGTHKSVAFRTGNRGYPFEQFDLRLNRPDIVLERLGAPGEAVTIAKKLREKRLKGMGVTEEMLKPDFHLPELEIVGDVPPTTRSGEIDLSIMANDSKYMLERLKVYVNNVPVNGSDGELLHEEGKLGTGLFGRIAGVFSGAAAGSQSLKRTIKIHLAAGRNKIQVSVLNNAGAESLYANVEVNCMAERPTPTVYVVALGVSDYSNPEWNLKYAAKDARDILQRLKANSGSQHRNFKGLLLTDQEVTKKSLAKVKDFLSGALIDDTVILFVAGHGILDSKWDYYFGTSNIDFTNPSSEGIAFEEFDNLLGDLPCIKKTLLIDTCHAGELDEEEKMLLASKSTGGFVSLPTGNGFGVRSIGTRGMNVRAVEGARGPSEWYDRLQGLFVDLRRGSGSTILSSSSGAEYALESSEQQNGLFTYAVLEALDGNKEADANQNGTVEMSELGKYVKMRVSQLTNNKQTPNTRRVNLEGDFIVARTK